MAGWRGYRRTYRGYGAGRQRASRLGSFALVAALHILAVLGIIAAFTPEIGRRAVQAGLIALDLRDSPPPPPPPPAAEPAEPAGTAGALGKKAVAAPIAVPPPRIAIAPVITAPIAASTGAALTSGARETGAGTGASGAAQGTGAGGAGTGSGGGTRAQKIAGDINSAKDYPIASRDARIGDYVIVAITVGPDGKPSACRVHRPSADPAADTITCKLALQRFRFKPATDANGTPIEATYGWKQSWHY